jgi:hypothetical protein
MSDEELEHIVDESERAFVGGRVRRAENWSDALALHLSARRFTRSNGQPNNEAIVRGMSILLDTIPVHDAFDLHASLANADCR